jgi:hypothetical protein
MANGFLNCQRLLTPRINEFMDFVHSPEFQTTRKHNVTDTESDSFLR